MSKQNGSGLTEFRPPRTIRSVLRHTELASILLELDLGAVMFHYVNLQRLSAPLAVVFVKQGLTATNNKPSEGLTSARIVQLLLLTIAMASKWMMAVVLWKPCRLT